jgi:hypothetical protein
MSGDRDAPILCLGEAIVDLVCEQELDAPTDAEAFRPHFGGALANVAVSAARSGAPAALAGGVGDDPWGRWLSDRLSSEGVGTDWFSRVAGLQTPLAFVTFDRRREPTFLIYGDGIDAGLHSVSDVLTEAVGSSSALVFGSNTLVDDALGDERVVDGADVLEFGEARPSGEGVPPGAAVAGRPAVVHVHDRVAGVHVGRPAGRTSRACTSPPGPGTQRSSTG